MKKGMWWLHLGVLALSGCAFTPSGKMEKALESGRAVVISPGFTEGGALWVRQGSPDQSFTLSVMAEAKTRIGGAYQMVVVEPGTYHLIAASGYAGPGRAVPGALAAPGAVGTVGQLFMLNRMYSEPYIERVWKDRVVERGMIPGATYCASAGRYGDCQVWGQNPPTYYERIAQEAGWYEEKRFRPAVNVVDRVLAFGRRGPLATLEVRAGDALLINTVRVPVLDVGHDAQRCAPGEEKAEVACPLDRVVVESGQINMDFFREQASTGRTPLDPALLARVKAQPVEPVGRRAGRSADGLALYEFSGAPAVAPRLTSPRERPAR